jgi:hypothetical protein
MAEIQEGNRVVTQITTVKFTPDKQDEVLNVMTERARFMTTQPGFVSIALHRSKDGTPRGQLCAVARCRFTRSRTPLAGVPQEVAAIWKDCRRDRAVPLRHRSR